MTCYCGYGAHFTTYDSNYNKLYYKRFCSFVKEMGYDADSIVKQHSNAKRLPFSKRFDIVFAEIMKDFPGIAGIRNESFFIGKVSDVSGFFELYDSSSKHKFELTVRDLNILANLAFEYDESKPLEQSVRELDAFIRSNGLLK